MQTIITIIQSILNWLEPKFNTKQGFLFGGICLGLIPPLSYAYYTEKYIEDIKKELNVYEAELNKKQEQIEYWQNRAFEAEQNHIQKTKEMIETLNSLEQYYIDKNNAQKENNKLVSTYIRKLDSVTKKLKKS